MHNFISAVLIKGKRGIFFGGHEWLTHKISFKCRYPLAFVIVNLCSNIVWPI